MYRLQIGRNEKLQVSTFNYIKLYLKLSGKIIVRSNLHVNLINKEAQYECADRKTKKSFLIRSFSEKCNRSLFITYLKKNTQEKFFKENNNPDRVVFIEKDSRTKSNGKVDDLLHLRCFPIYNCRSTSAKPAVRRSPQ